MDQSLFRCVLVSLIIIFKTQNVCAIMNVFDSSNYMNLTHLITSSGKQLNEQKLTTAGLDSLNSSIGSGLPFNFSTIESMIRRKSFSLSDFSVSRYDISGFETRKRDFTSYRSTMEESILGRFSDKGVLSHVDREAIGQRRDSLVKESILSGLALSSQQKESLHTSQAELGAILNEAKRARDLRSDIATTNRLLALIANEAIQTRALLLQQLEIESAKSSKMLPISLEKRGPNKTQTNSLNGFIGKGTS